MSKLWRARWRLSWANNNRDGLSGRLLLIGRVVAKSDCRHLSISRIRVCSVCHPASVWCKSTLLLKN
jgi:hypothetical protein